MPPKKLAKERRQLQVTVRLNLEERRVLRGLARFAEEPEAELLRRLIREEVTRSRGVEGFRGEDTSLVAHDGSVELPAYVREALGIKSGEFVYFVKQSDDSFRIVSMTEMEEALGGR